MAVDDQAGLVTRIADSLQRERRRAGLSAAELARRAGLAKSTLSQLESGSGNPGVETLWSLANALAIPLSHLIDPPLPVVQVIRAHEGEPARSEHADYAATLLAAAPAAVRRDVYRIDAGRGPAKLSQPHQAGTVEHVVLLTGRARVGPPDDALELAPGDYARYPGDQRHLFEALTERALAVLIMEQR